MLPVAQNLLAVNEHMHHASAVFVGGCVGGVIAYLCGVENCNIGIEARCEFASLFDVQVLRRKFSEFVNGVR